MPDLVTPVTMGSPIPEWLLALEPAAPNAHKTHFRFGIDVDVIDTPDYYVVVPKVIGNFANVLDAAGTYGCKIMAASKPVWVVTRYDIVFPEHIDASGLQPPMQPPPSGPVYVPEPVTSSFWARLRYAITGRF